MNNPSNDTEKISKLNNLIKKTLDELEYEEKTKKTYTKEDGCDKKNIRRIYDILYLFDSIKEKEKLKSSIYTILHILWSNVTEEEKKKIIKLSMVPTKTGCTLTKVPETFSQLDYISQWVRLNSISSNPTVPYLLFTLNTSDVSEKTYSNKDIIPLINKKIQEINQIISINLQDIQLMDKLFELIVLFQRLNDPKTTLLRKMLDKNRDYYKNIFTMIQLLWKHIETHVPNYTKHSKYPYIYVNMDLMNKTYTRSKIMNKISKSTLKKISNKGYLKTLENVERLKNVDLLTII